MATSTQDSPPSHAERVQCAPLMSVATIDLFKKNGFRITGLAVDATSKEVSKRGERLKMMEEMGHGAAVNTNAFPLNPPPSVDEIRESLQRLKDPETRLIEEFFWFWPESFGQSAADEAIQAYVTGQGERAFDLWIERKSDPDKKATAYHNLAVVNHLMAIEWSLHYLEAAPDEASSERMDAYWSTSTRYWRRTIQDDDVWDKVKNRIRGLDDPRLTTGLARRMRELLPEALATINASFAFRLAERGRISETRTHIGYIKKFKLEPALEEEIFAHVLAPLRDRFSNGIKPAADSDLDPKKRFEAAKAILNQAPALSHLMELFFGKTSHHRTELFDEMALACAYAATAYQKATGDLEGFIAISKDALTYASATEARNRVKENIDFGEQGLRQKSIEPFLKGLENIASSGSTPEAKLSAIKETVMPQVASFLQREGPNSPLSHDLQTAVAYLLRRISLEAYNDHEDISTAKEATLLASKLARDPELKKRLVDDKKTLDDNEVAELKSRLDLRIRDDRIEVNRQYVKYNQTRINVSDINGVRFGVYRHSTNGIQDSCSYLIGLSCTRGGSIKIECKRFFRSEDQARSDYEAILHSIFSNVIPGIALKAGQVAVRDRFHLGDAVMTADGMTLSSGMLMWRKDVFVPYSEIRYGFNQGNLTVVKNGDNSVNRSFVVRDQWNAVIFEQILKAIQIVKSKK